MSLNFVAPRDQGYLEAQVANLLGTLAMLRGDDRGLIPDLGRNQSALVRLLQRRPGSFIAKHALEDAIYGDGDVPIHGIPQTVHEIKKNRPDLWARIEGQRDHGYRWIEEESQ